MVDSPYRVKPGKKINLDKIPSDEKGDFDTKEEAALVTEKLLKRLDALQEVLYAEAKHSLLIVFQAMDAGGKDGSIEQVFSGINPQGCMVTSFKIPTPLEKAHDFLWRIHTAMPPKGMIGIFNRSHYESVLVERVKQLVPEKIWKARFGHIRDFEQMLAEEGTVILKFYLHISRDEQKQRLQARLEDPAKNWKFNPGDLLERENWQAYRDAYHDAINKCSTEHAPWFVIPADRKWFRNWAICDTIVQALEALNMKFPPPVSDLSKIKIS